jgi:hypothetical protein
MEGIYEFRHWDGLNCYDINTKFNKFDSGIQKLMGGFTETQSRGTVIP